MRPFLAGGHSEDRSGRRRASAPPVRPYLLTGGRSRSVEVTLAVEAPHPLFDFNTWREAADLFLAALDADERPNAALRKAAQRFKRRSG